MSATQLVAGPKCGSCLTTVLQVIIDLKEKKGLQKIIVGGKIRFFPDAEGNGGILVVVKVTFQKNDAGKFRPVIESELAALKTK